MNGKLAAFAQRSKIKLKSFGKTLLQFSKVNYLMCAYILASVLIELTGVAVTAGKFYMTDPWLYLTFLALACLISQYLPGHKSRYVLFLTALSVNFILDLIFIMVYDSTGGTVFDFAMLNLHSDAMRIVESLPLSFTYIFVSAVVLALYTTLGFMFTRRMPKPNVTRSARITSTALVLAVLSGNVLLSYFGNYRFDSNDLSYKLYQPETGTYSNKGIVGNFYNEMIRGFWFSDIDIGDTDELHDFIYKHQTESTPLTGRATGFNVVTVLCESFEWFTFLYDAERYPNGYACPIANKFSDSAAQIKTHLRELFPNLYKFYESTSTTVFNNSYSLNKTDISENETIIGNYPLYQYINYAYPTNTMPYSIPNILKNLYGVESNSFHNGYKTFYNRNEHHTNALGFNSFTAAEDIYEPTEDGGGVGERNLDSVMFETCKQQMFPTDRRFNTYITTITQHGQYAKRDNLRPYYDKLDSLGILPYAEDEDDANALRYYCAAGMDTDKAIGIMLDYLDANGLADNTIITLFGDHNAYYQGVSNYVKNIYSTDSANYLELYRVPVMIKAGNLNLGNPVINKFTCVLDIYPTILDLLGISVFSNLTYGVSAYSEKQSILYSRAYDKFMTDKIYFNSLSNIIYKSPDIDADYIDGIKKNATELLEKISHVNRIFAADYFKGNKASEFYTLLKQINEPVDINGKKHRGALTDSVL